MDVRQPEVPSLGAEGEPAVCEAEEVEDGGRGDRGRNYTADENAGKNIFMRPPNQGGAGCAGCHNPQEFDITPVSGNNGVVGSLGGGSGFTTNRAPTLRDLVDANCNPHGGFMHDASLPTLLSVIDHYNAIPASRSG